MKKKSKKPFYKYGYFKCKIIIWSYSIIIKCRKLNNFVPIKGYNKSSKKLKSC